MKPRCNCVENSSSDRCVEDAVYFYTYYEAMLVERCEVHKISKKNNHFNEISEDDYTVRMIMYS